MNKNNYLTFHYNGKSSYIFLSDAEIYKLKAKVCEIIAGLLCLGNFSNNFSVDNMDYTDMSMIFQSNMKVLMLLIFWVVMFNEWTQHKIKFEFIKNGLFGLLSV